MADHPEQYIDVRGCAYVVLALDIAPFVKPEHRQALEYLRGRAEFSAFLETTFFADPRFERDTAYRTLEQQGYELGVFDKLLLTHHFAPTYQLKKEQIGPAGAFEPKPTLLKPPNAAKTVGFCKQPSS